MVKASLKDILQKNKICVIDGSMGTALEQLGANLNDKLWTAKVLAEQPELVKQVHLMYLRAGADAHITCSYQATIPGLMAGGYSEKEAEDLIVRSVKLFLETRDEWWEKEGKSAGRAYPLCLAGIGPYGAYLADGSEYKGHYGVSDQTLYDFHARRAELLWQAGADVLLFETQPSLAESKIEAEIAEKLGATYWISYSCKDAAHINEGDAIVDCACAFKEGYLHLEAMGANCSKPEYMEGLVKELRKGTTLPIFVYPNSGEIYDPVTKTWHGSPDSRSFKEYALAYMKAGASAVGGCCTTVAEHIGEVVEARKEFTGK
ncbi:MAG: homocysteine S-methyltransferase [Acidaminococcus sp.]|jgi:homocysteine S-methyltransferase|nr:homocysteine S-methyltransferase [Acidaminococcus sp.]MCI2099961.1 homocysteine S-methyltransferase [Acidaminococcus sp.]MCI2114237.1 homocysteine S-methyltransferase [Acidaminococcus sp.]